MSKDLYKILKVSRTATMHEIKTSYRQLALVLHPDRHDGDEIKVQAFKDASDAYSILSDNARRRQYDMAQFGTGRGGWSGSRRRPPPSNYRKVYAPHAPPDGKWHDAQRHYDMHYGDGTYREELQRAQTKAKERGEYEYHSPLGKGFTFGKLHDDIKKKKEGNQRVGVNDDDDDGSTIFDEQERNGYGIKSQLQNPYSKAAQGPPPPPMWLYEEGYIGEAKIVLNRKIGVTERLQARRKARKQQQEEEQQQQAEAQQQQREQQQQQQQRTRGPMEGAMNCGSTGGTTGSNRRANIPQYEAFNHTSTAPGCSIM